MSQKSELQTQLEAKRVQVQQLEKLKGTENWNESLEEQLNLLYGEIADMEEELEEAEAEAKKTADGYNVPKGSEESVHLLIHTGNRFDPHTGKPISTPYLQIFSRNEWNLFKQHYRGLGYVIDKVLHDPYNEAEKYVVK